MIYNSTNAETYREKVSEEFERKKQQFQRLDYWGDDIPPILGMTYGWGTITIYFVVIEMYKGEFPAYGVGIAIGLIWLVCYIFEKREYSKCKKEVNRLQILMTVFNAMPKEFKTAHKCSKCGTVCSTNALSYDENSSKPFEIAVLCTCPKCNNFFQKEITVNHTSEGKTF